ncbi:uncharacterized protein LOC129595763 [Paramacrobiotus metropolitanus]|uniref:uncharacterized protein LOC129595763 n=1 Tax=Paramacrobiotus metropolitanus TaxID=2943436 RepID=UPI0024464DF6|nr:uncharacterized protein LOC129595763 [Paramacrobiotus metropolitanus]
MPSGMNLDTAVSVRGSDQRMCVAHIVDVTQDGLIVDLLCPTRRREFAPFGTVFFPYCPTCSTDLDELYAQVVDQQRSTISVEVLVPETPAGPWIWLPGEMQCVGRSKTLYGAAVVNWQRPDDGLPCFDIVPMQHMRLLRNRKNDAITCKEIPPGAFIRRSVDLGEEFRSLSGEDAQVLIQRLNGCRLEIYSCFQSLPVVVVDIVDGQLHYMCKLGQEDKSALVSGSNLLEKIEAFHGELLTTIKSLREKQIAVNEDVVAWNALPNEIWQEVFSCEDTLTQTKLPTVCPTWNRLLDAPALHATLVIRNSNPSCKLADFLCLATVYKCLSPGTQLVVINVYGGYCSWSEDYAMEVGDMIQYVAERHTGIRLRTVHLYGIRLNWLINKDRAIVYADMDECGLHPYDPDQSMLDTERGYDWLEDFIAMCRSLPCDAIQMSNCRVTLAIKLFYAEEGTHLGAKFQFNIGTARLELNDGFDCALWETLEGALRMPSEQQCLKIAASIKEETMEEAICKILCLAQSGDPRPSSHYREKEWCPCGWVGRFAVGEIVADYSTSAQATAKTYFWDTIVDGNVPFVKPYYTCSKCL